MPVHLLLPLESGSVKAARIKPTGPELDAPAPTLPPAAPGKPGMVVGMEAGTALRGAVGCDACARGVAGTCGPGKKRCVWPSVTRKDSRSWLRMPGGR